MKDFDERYAEAINYAVSLKDEEPTKEIAEEIEKLLLEDYDYYMVMAFYSHLPGPLVVRFVELTERVVSATLDDIDSGGVADCEEYRDKTSVWFVKKKLGYKY